MFEKKNEINENFDKHFSYPGLNHNFQGFLENPLWQGVENPLGKHIVWFSRKGSLLRLILTNDSSYRSRKNCWKKLISFRMGKARLDSDTNRAGWREIKAYHCDSCRISRVYLFFKWAMRNNLHEFFFINISPLSERWLLANATRF